MEVVAVAQPAIGTWPEHPVVLAPMVGGVEPALWAESLAFRTGGQAAICIRRMALPEVWVLVAVAREARDRPNRIQRESTGSLRGKVASTTLPRVRAAMAS